MPGSVSGVDACVLIRSSCSQDDVALRDCQSRRVDEAGAGQPCDVHYGEHTPAAAVAPAAPIGATQANSAFGLDDFGTLGASFLGIRGNSERRMGICSCAQLLSVFSRQSGKITGALHRVASWRGRSIHGDYK